MTDRVHYEGWIDLTKAAKARLFEAVLQEKGRLDAKDTYALDSRAGSTLVFLVYLEPARAEDFARQARLREPLRYRSPERLRGSTIRPVYKSPEAEIADRRRLGPRFVADRDVCVVCGAVLAPPDSPPHCEYCRVTDDHTFEWETLHRSEKGSP